MGKGRMSAMELPYMAPWVELGHDETQTKHEGKRGKYGTMAPSPHREEPYMTAAMPYLAPWIDADAIEPGRGSPDVLLSSPTPAHLPHHNNRRVSALHVGEE